MLRMTIFSENKSDESRESVEITISEIISEFKETKAASETSSQEIAENTYRNTIEHVTKEFGSIMPESQLVRINIESEKHKPTVLSSEVYSNRFSEADPSVLGHCDSEGRVFLKEGSPEAIMHVITHEVMHLTSYKELDDSDMSREVYRSGIREAIYTPNGLEVNNNEALNEGITELYALREMRLCGNIASIEAVSAYPEAQRKAYELQEIVGSDVIQKAYFGGNSELLKSEVNRISYGDETAWERYSKNVDVLEFGTDSDEVQNARKALAIQNAIMISFLESEAQAETNVRKR